MKLLAVAVIGLGLAGTTLIAHGQQGTTPTCPSDMSHRACELTQLDALMKRLDQASANMAHTKAGRSYALAIQSAVTKNWVVPDGLPNAVCKVHIVQRPGGAIESATADASCPFNDRGRLSVVNAVLRTQSLPYKGYESVFRRNITLTFVPPGTQVTVSGTELY